MAKRDKLDDDVINKGLIGEGAFGKVYLVEKNGKEYAVKIMDVSVSSDQKEVVENEIKVLKELQHENVIVYMESFLRNNFMYIICEYCPGGDLSHFLDRAKTPVPEDLLVAWLWQMTCGLEYMHLKDPPVLHRDLKPTNIYLNEHGDLRLGDLGIARIMESPTAMAETFCGTPPYMSPEALYARPYNAKTDIWALGCCVVEMATLNRAYQGSSIYILRSVVNKQREPLPESYSKGLDELVSNMLLPDYKQRFSSSQILDSALLQKCGEFSEPPQVLLKKHNMMKFLACKPPSETMHTLPESMSNIKEVLNNPETLASYHIRIEKRMRYRTDQPTLVNQDSMKTVLHNPDQKTVNKTTKRAPPVPRRSSSLTDDSMLRAVTTSFKHKLDSAMKSMNQAPVPEDKEAQQFSSEKEDKQNHDSTVSSMDSTVSSLDSSASSLTAMFRRTFSQLVDSSDVSRVSTLIQSQNTSTSELQSAIQTLLRLPDSQSTIAQMFIFVTLRDSFLRAAREST